MKAKTSIYSAAVAGLLLVASHSSASGSYSYQPKTKSVESGQCHGVNACKGKSACGGAENSCAGKNACKGQGWVKMSEKKCDELGGDYKSNKS